MMRNGFWALGPNVTGYAGGYPNGFLQRCKHEGIWGARRLHVCSGTVVDGVTVDLSRAPKGRGGGCDLACKLTPSTSRSATHPSTSS